MQLSLEDRDGKVEHVPDTLFRKEKVCLCLVTRPVKTRFCGFPLLVAQELFHMLRSLVEVQECQSVVGLLLCPSFVPFLNCWKCGIYAAFWALRGDWCPAYLSGMTGLAKI